MLKKTIIFSILILASLTITVGKVNAAKLYIDPPTGTYTQNQQFQARIVLDTENQETAGTDVYLRYNPTMLQALKIQKGKIYTTYLGKNIDNTNGALSISGIISLDAEKGYSGTGTFATIVFKGIGIGTSQVTFDYTPGSKNDSNVAVLDLPDDNLTNATGASYTITASSGGGNGDGEDTGGGGGGEGNGNAGGENGKGGLPVPTKAAELPKSGSIGDTFKIIGAGFGTLLASLLLLL